MIRAFFINIVNINNQKLGEKITETVSEILPYTVIFYNSLTKKLGNIFITAVESSFTL